jgi:hypothetical protein
MEEEDEPVCLCPAGPCAPHRASETGLYNVKCNICSARPNQQAMQPKAYPALGRRPSALPGWSPPFPCKPLV